MDGHKCLIMGSTMQTDSKLPVSCFWASFYVTDVKNYQNAKLHSYCGERMISMGLRGRVFSL